MILPPVLEERLRLLMRVFLEENAKINLSALRTEDTCWVGNILDSLPLLEMLPRLGEVKRIIDVGTGGGFPLLPLAIAMPDTHFVGLDATGKKVDTVRRIAAKAGIANVELLQGRSEQAAHDKPHRDAYDLVLARAVAPLPTLLELTGPFARIGGHLILWKSLHADEEIAQSKRAAQELHLVPEAPHRYALPADFGERQLLAWRKGAATPRAYPRADGMPKKTPLA
jgi:16S rRNA (guanine527-N7)-methyltransferase